MSGLGLLCLASVSGAWAPCAMARADAVEEARPIRPHLPGGQRRALEKIGDAGDGGFSIRRSGVSVPTLEALERRDLIRVEWVIPRALARRAWVTSYGAAVLAAKRT